MSVTSRAVAPAGRPDVPVVPATRPGAARRGSRQRAVLAWLLLVSTAGMLLRAAVPPLVDGNATFDDLLFVSHARDLAAGRWLGPFDAVVGLAKGMGYPAFLAGAHALGVPALLAQQALHLLAAAAVAWTAYRLAGSRALGVALYTVLALDPSFYGTRASQFTRDSWYASVCLLLLGLAARPLAPGASGPRSWWALLRELAAGAVLGGALAAYWLGREERPWLLPPLAVLVAARGLRGLRGLRGRRATGRWLPGRPGRRAAERLLCAGVTVALAVGVPVAVAARNRQVYGVGLTNDVTEGQFAAAFGQWQAVRAGPVRRYVPISRPMRLAVYAVSPAARQLAPGMEGGIGRLGFPAGCASRGTCDITAGWTQWAMRSSLSAAGRHGTAPQVQQFWRAVAQQIRSACASHRLTCRPVTPFLLPQPDTVRAADVGRSAVVAATYLTDFGLGAQTSTPSRATPGNWAVFTGSVRGLPRTLAGELRRERAFRPYAQQVAVVAGLYRLAVLPLGLFALLGYLVAPWRRRRGWSAPYVLGAAAVLAVVCRLGLLALVDATSFAAARTSYLLPASGALLLAVGMGLWSLAHAVRPLAAGPPAAAVRLPGPAAAPGAEDGCELSVVLPCLDEAQTLEACITKAMGSLRRLQLDGEVVVADNGSTDGSQDIARRLGARVVDVPVRGYGSALRAGIAAARGRWVLMADADDSYALEDLGPFLAALREGNDLVVGNRFAGGIEPGAMPALHRYLGNPVLSLVGRLFFRIPVRDFHCGIRAFDRRRTLALGLRSTGMEFASELIVTSALSGLRIAEVPTVLRPDGRSRPPHLRSWRDGWRHLRFLLLFSPRWLFLYPGAALAVAGLVLVLRLSLGPVTVGGAVLDTQSLLFGGAAVVVGVQAMLLAVLSRVYAASRGILPSSSRLLATRHPWAVERGLLLGAALLAVGVAGTAVAVLSWAHAGFGELGVEQAMRLAVPTVTCLSLGAECLMASFFLGLLQLDEQIEAAPAAAGESEQA